MATGPQHYRDAELLLRTASASEPSVALGLTAMAVAHGLLALAAATALNDPVSGAPLEDCYAWTTAVSVTTAAPAEPQPTEV